MFVRELWLSPKLVRIICAPLYRLLQVRCHNECLNTKNIITVLLLSKCQIQIMIRKITNTGIAMVNIFIILVRLLYQQINNVDMLLCYMS